jgi:hypothetical protein
MIVIYQLGELRRSIHRVIVRLQLLDLDAKAGAKLQIFPVLRHDFRLVSHEVQSREASIFISEMHSVDVSLK